MFLSLSLSLYVSVWSVGRQCASTWSCGSKSRRTGAFPTIGASLWVCVRACVCVCVCVYVYVCVCVCVRASLSLSVYICLEVAHLPHMLHASATLAAPGVASAAALAAYDELLNLQTFAGGSPFVHLQGTCTRTRTRSCRSCGLTTVYVVRRRARGKGGRRTHTAATAAHRVRRICLCQTHRHTDKERRAGAREHWCKYGVRAARAKVDRLSVSVSHTRARVCGRVCACAHTCVGNCWWRRRRCSGPPPRRHWRRACIRPSACAHSLMLLRRFSDSKARPCPRPHTHRQTQYHIER
jgi:hypothetical protein